MMTDRYNYFVVALAEDARADDAEPILAAIRMVKGVQSVVPHVADLTDHMARERARMELAGALWDVLKP